MPLGAVQRDTFIELPFSQQTVITSDGASLRLRVLPGAEMLLGQQVAVADVSLLLGPKTSRESPSAGEAPCMASNYLGEDNLLYTCSPLYRSPDIFQV